MWAPGTLVQLKRGNAWRAFGSTRTDLDEPIVMFIIAFEQVSFGTRGPRYRTSFLCQDRIHHTVIDVETLYRCFNVVREVA